MPHLLVLGSSNTDLVIQGDRLPHPGETILGSDYFQAFGGKGANQAVAVARAGGEVTLIAAVGDDAFGRQALEQYRREGLRLDHVRIIKDRASGVALILVDAAGQNMISVYPGANAALTSADVEALPENVFRENQVFVAQLESPIETVRAGLNRARRAGLFTLLNPAPARPSIDHPDLLGDVDLLVPNESEAELLSGIRIDGIESAREAGRALMRLGPRHVIVTLGAQGCVVAGASGTADEPDWDHVPAIPVAAVDSVAAGDAFVGALARRLAEEIAQGREVKNILRESAWWANHAAAISVQRRGAQSSLPYRSEIEASMQRAKV